MYQIGESISNVKENLLNSEIYPLVIREIVSSLVKVDQKIEKHLPLVPFGFLPNDVRFDSMNHFFNTGKEPK